MLAGCLEKRLIEQLNNIPEFGASGFVVRAGLTGNGVTLLKGRSYFGAWRKTCGYLVWTYANNANAPFQSASLEDAIRHTMKMILFALEASKGAKNSAARPELANRTA